MATKRRKTNVIYDEDNLKVEEVIGTDEAETPTNYARAKRSVMLNEQSKSVSMEDFIDTLFGYSSSRVSNKWNRPDNGRGQCMFCGASTMYTTRKICLDCFEKNNDELYKNSKEAAQNGQDRFEINYKGKDNG